jgi:hypothetical protein
MRVLPGAETAVEQYAELAGIAVTAVSAATAITLLTLTGDCGLAEFVSTCNQDLKITRRAKGSVAGDAVVIGRIPAGNGGGFQRPLVDCGYRWKNGDIIGVFNVGGTPSTGNVWVTATRGVITDQQS